MRKFVLMFLVTVAGCAARKPAVADDSVVPEDPEMTTACVPDWTAPPPAVCEKDGKGRNILTKADPSFGPITQILNLEKDMQGTGTADVAVIELSNRVLTDPKATACGKQIARWHRAMALAERGHWKEAYLDFGAVIKDGPNGPFYVFVREWLLSLQAHIPHAAFITCMSAYDPTALATVPVDPDASLKGAVPEASEMAPTAPPTDAGPPAGGAAYGGRRKGSGVTPMPRGLPMPDAP
jgi:hypothetical protein